jgi:predicted amidohydrolase YtcJ
LDEALRTITINAAWQLGCSSKKGSIQTGKDADFVVLSHNPTNLPLKRLREIAVVSTVSLGNVIYNASKL